MHCVSTFLMLNVLLGSVDKYGRKLPSSKLNRDLKRYYHLDKCNDEEIQETSDQFVEQSDEDISSEGEIETSKETVELANFEKVLVR
jgi:hypothetical protein